MLKQIAQNIPGCRAAVSACRRFQKKNQFRRQLKSRDQIKLVIGSAGIFEKEWIPSERYFLDLLKPADWQRYFNNNVIQAILAEHVWEHLTLEQGLVAAKQCFEYLRPGGYLRFAVPDGYHPDPDYIAHVKVGGTGPGSDDHKVLYTYETAQKLFRAAGFEVILLEYFDETGRFCSAPWDPANGKIHRSKQFDERNKVKALSYTSLILDAHKPAMI